MVDSVRLFSEYLQIVVFVKLVPRINLLLIIDIFVHLCRFVIDIQSLIWLRIGAVRMDWFLCPPAVVFYHVQEGPHLVLDVWNCQ